MGPESVDDLTVASAATGVRLPLRRCAAVRRPHGLDSWPKSKGLALEAFPSLAARRVAFDHDARRVRVSHDDTVPDSTEGKLMKRPRRLPLSLIGDGQRSRFQDRAAGHVSVHSAASVDALNDALPQQVDHRRCRSNIVIDGVDAWDELSVPAVLA